MEQQLLNFFYSMIADVMMIFVAAVSIVLIYALAGMAVTFLRRIS